MPRRPDMRSLAAVALVGVVALVGCGREAAPDLANGKKLFAGEGTCGSCHALARANTKAKVGPDLDAAFANAKRKGLGEKTIAGLVENQIAHPRNGSSMQPNLVKGDDARDVAAYVAYAAARGGKDAGILATAAQPKKGPPAVAKDGVLDLPADPTGGLAYVTDKASAPPGSIKFVSKNDSPIQHNIALKGPVTATGPVVGSGGTSEFTADVKPGEYTFFCSVPGHEEGGMKGTLTVK